MKKKIIIFEGLNNTLKTTIINNFMMQTKDNYHIMHYGKPPRIDNVIKYQQLQYVQMFRILEEMEYNFILDRSHLGECVWAPVYRDYDNSDAILHLEKEFLFRVDDTKNVYLFTLIDTEFERYKKREDGLSFHDGDLEKHNSEIKYFTDIHKRSNIKKKWIIDLKDFYLAPDSGQIADQALLEFVNLKIGKRRQATNRDHQYAT